MTQWSLGGKVVVSFTLTTWPAAGPYFVTSSTTTGWRSVLFADPDSTVDERKLPHGTNGIIERTAPTVKRAFRNVRRFVSLGGGGLDAGCGTGGAVAGRGGGATGGFGGTWAGGGFVAGAGTEVPGGLVGVEAAPAVFFSASEESCLEGDDSLESSTIR